MPELLQDPLPFVRCSACDCMSLIGEQTFVELPVSVFRVFETPLRIEGWRRSGVVGFLIPDTGPTHAIGLVFRPMYSTCARRCCWGLRQTPSRPSGPRQAGTNAFC